MRATKLSLCLIALAGHAAAEECPRDGTSAPLARHKAWILDGWERREGDPRFSFATKMKEYYDLNAPRGTFYDNFAPGKTQLFDDAAVYGANWEDLQNAAHTVRHALTDGHDQIIGDRVASTTIGFVGQIDRLDGKTLAFDGRSQLAWSCTNGTWKIRQEMNYAWIVSPESIQRYYRKDALK